MMIKDPFLYDGYTIIIFTFAILKLNQ